MLELFPVVVVLFASVAGVGGVYRLVGMAKREEEMHAEWREFATENGFAHGLTAGLPQLVGQRDGLELRMGIVDCVEPFRSNASQPPAAFLEVTRAAAVPSGFVLELERRPREVATGAEVFPDDSRLREILVMSRGSLRASDILASDTGFVTDFANLAPETSVRVEGRAVRIVWKHALSPTEVMRAFPVARRLARLELPADIGASDDPMNQKRSRAWTFSANRWRALAEENALAFACGEQVPFRRKLPTVTAVIGGVPVSAGLRGRGGEIALPWHQADAVRTEIRAERLFESSLVVSIEPMSLTDRVTALVRRDDVEIGDAPFDRAFYVVANDADRCREIFGDVSLRDMLREVVGDFVLRIDQRSISLEWSDEMAPKAVWRAAPLIVRLAHLRSTAPLHAYR